MKWLAPVLLIGGCSGQTCYLPVDVYFVQDTTGSFIEDLVNVKKQLPTLIDALNKSNPGSHFGVAEFRDKPYNKMGELSDFCYKVTHPLSDDLESVQRSIDKLFASGGQDYPEAQLHAIIDAVNDKTIGWRPLVDTKTNPQGGVGARLIIMSTDAKPHDPGDYEIYPDSAPMSMQTFPDSVVGLSSDILCRRYDYPSVDQMKTHLEQQQTYLAILTPNDDPEVVAKWRWINDDILKNPIGFYQFIENDSSNIVESISEVMKSVTEFVCATTAAPTTAAPTTTSGEAATTTTPAAPQTSLPTATPIPPATVTQDDCHPRCEEYGLVVKVNDKPKKLVVDYEKSASS